MKISRVTLALGANLGDRQGTLVRTHQLIEQRIGPIVARSSIISTPAWGGIEQPDYLNQVIVVNPGVWRQSVEASRPLEIRMHGLLDITQDIEQQLGRVRLQRWGARSCDVDIIFVDRLRMVSNRLQLPHPWWSSRDFVGGLIERELPDVMPFGKRSGLRARRAGGIKNVIG